MNPQRQQRQQRQQRREFRFLIENLTAFRQPSCPAGAG